MGTYTNIICSEQNPYTISSTSGTFRLSVNRTTVRLGSQDVLVTWSLNGVSASIYQGSFNYNETKSFTIRKTALLNALNNTGTGTLTLRSICSGETVTQTFTVKVDATQIKSQFTSTTQSIRSTPLRGYLISGYSTAQINYYATKGYGATQTEYTFSTPIGEVNPDSATSTSSSQSGLTLLTIPRRDSDISFYTVLEVRDSRGQTVDRRNVETSWKGYTLPQIVDVEAFRCDAQGNRDDSGDHVSIMFSGQYSLTNIGNVGHVSLTVGSQTYTDPSTPIILSQAQNVAKTYTIIATDTVINSASETVRKSVTVNMAKFPLDLYDDGHGHLGARVGAIAKSGWFTSGLKNELTEDTILRNHYANMTSSYISINSGYRVLATFTIISTYANAPIYLKVQRRGYLPVSVNIQFAGVNGTDPTLEYFRTDITPTYFYLYKSDTSTWQLIVTTTGYDCPCITDVQMSYYQTQRMTVDYTISYLSAVPTGSTQAKGLPMGDFFYGVCSTGGGTVRKEVSVGSFFTLRTGITIYVKFANANSIANPTLNVNGTGAIAIKRYGTTAPSTSRASSWNANSVVCLVYDGTYWQMLGWENTTYSAISQANIENVSGTTSGLITGTRFTQGLKARLGIGIEKIQYLSGLSGTAENGTTLRVNIPIPPCSSVTASLDTSTTASITGNNAQNSVTLTAVTVKDISLASVMVEITLSGVTLTQYRHYMFRNGTIKLTCS